MNAVQPLCPKCRRAIPAADVNVANDVAFCRACNVANKLSAMVHDVPVDTDVDLTRPPAGTWYQSTGLGAVIGASHRSLTTAFGLLFFMLFWNGIVSVFVALALASTLNLLGVPLPEWAQEMKVKGSNIGVGMTIFLWIFLLPFILIGLTMVAGFFSALFGRTEVRIHHSHGHIFSGIGPVGRPRHFNTAAVKEIRVQNEEWNSRKGNRHRRTAIAIETDDGKVLKFGSALPLQRMQFVAAAVRKAVLENRV
jgi:hypothetical protein